jgi:hypothetical protein
MTEASPKLPHYAVFVVRLGISPTDWYDFETCLENRYQEIYSDEGSVVATKWLYKECIWVLMEGAKRFLRGGF